MVDHLPLVVWLPTAVIAWAAVAVIARRDVIARRRTTRHHQ